MTWWDGRMLGLDFETTSPEPEEARIVTAALAIVGGDVAPYVWQQLVNPGVEIPAEATEIHGITTEQARADGMAPADVLPIIVDALAEARAQGWPVVVFNARYDLTVADRELRRHRLELSTQVIPDLRVIDPLVLDKHLDRYRPKRVASHSLEDACRVWNATLDGAHDATNDAMAACRLAWRLCKQGQVIRRVRGAKDARELTVLQRDWDRVRGDLEALHEWQREIAVAEAARLEAYFRAGNPAKDVPAQPDRVVPRDWPFLPYQSLEDMAA